MVRCIQSGVVLLHSVTEPGAPIASGTLGSTPEDGSGSLRPAVIPGPCQVGSGCSLPGHGHPVRDAVSHLNATKRSVVARQASLIDVHFVPRAHIDASGEGYLAPSRLRRTHSNSISSSLVPSRSCLGLLAVADTQGFGTLADCSRCCGC
jgi:hypothetical protein